VTVPTPSMAETAPPCVPVAPAAALPPAVPSLLLTKPKLLLVPVNSPDPDAFETPPQASEVVADPLPLALPPLVAVPVTSPCSFLSGVHNRRTFVFLVGLEAVV
jgi:hypothetical protein